MKIKFLDEYRGLPKEIYMLFTANVINRFGDFVAPFLTLYLSMKLDLKVNIISIIVTVCVLSRIPGSILGGKMADNYGRKSSYLIFQLFAGLALLPCAFLKNAYIIVILIILSTFLNGAVRPALETLSMDIIPEEKRKIGFSLMYLGINLGVAIGPVLAGFLFKISLPLFFIVDTLTSLIAVAIVALKIKERYVVDKKNNQSNFVPAEGFIKIALKNIQLFYVLLLVSIFSLAYSQTQFSLPLLLEDLFKKNSAAQLGILFNINALTVLFITTWVTTKTKDNSSIKNLRLAGIFYGIGFAGYALFNKFILFMFVTIVWTVGEIIQVSNQKVYIAEHTEPRYRGQMNAVSASLKSAMNSLSILLGGFLIPLVGTRKIWIFCTLTCFLVVIGLYYLDKNFRKTVQKVKY